MKIYAITKGWWHSDYHICALTTDRAKAERLSKAYASGEDNVVIEEFEDNEGQDLMLHWRCDRNGCNPVIDDYPGNEYVWASGQTIHCVYLYAKDADHAEKKAHDMIAEYKARLTDI